MTDKLDTGRPVAARGAMVPNTVLAELDLPTVLVFHDVASLVESFRSLEPTRHAPPARPLGPVAAPIPTPAPSVQSGHNGASQPVHGSHTGVNGAHTAGNGAHSPGANGSHRLNGSGPGTAGLTNPDFVAPPTPVSAQTTAPSPLLDPIEVGAGIPGWKVTDAERSSYGVLLDRAAERGLLDSSEYEVRLRQLAEATTTAEMVAIVSELPAFTPLAGAAAPQPSRSVIQSASRTAAGSGQRRRLVVWVLMGVLVLLALISLVILALSVGRISRSRSSMPQSPPVATRPVSALRL